MADANISDVNLCKQNRFISNGGYQSPTLINIHSEDAGSPIQINGVQLIQTVNKEKNYIDLEVKYSQKSAAM